MTAGGVVVGVGPGIANLQDYTQVMPYERVKINAQAGAQLDQFTADLWDPLSQTTIAPEDDIVVLDCSDPNGFPTVNLLANPSLEGAYVSGVAPGWVTTGGGTGVTFASSGTAKFGALSQSLALSNAAISTISVGQTNAIPTNEFGAAITALQYYWSCWVNVSPVFVNTTGQITLQYLNSSNTVLNTYATPLRLNQTGWQFYYVNAYAPAGTAKILINLQLTTSSTTNSGTILLDGAQLEYSTFSNSYVGIFPQGILTAAQAFIYPTPFTDPAQSTTHTDRLISRYYRSIRLFGGYIRSIDNDYTAGPERIRTINAVDYGVTLQEAPANLTITAATDYAAIQQAAAYATSITSGLLGGIDTTTYVQQIATIDSFQVTQNTFRDVIDHIANDTQATYWVDYDKYLHYAGLLAISAPFGFSSSPDLKTTFPFDHFTYTQDSTQSLSAKIIEGGTQVSAPQTASYTQITTTLSAGLTSGTTYTTLSVPALAKSIPTNWTLLIGTGGTTQTVTVSSTANIGATTISVASFKANATYASGASLAVNGIVTNSGSPLFNVTAVTVGGTGQTVGLTNATGSGSYQVLANLQTALVSFTFTTPPTNGTAIVITFTYQYPVLVRVRNAAAESALGALRRPIHSYTKLDHVTSIQSATDIGNAELVQNGKQKPIGALYCKSPPCPTGTPLRPGQAVQVTHAAAGFSKSLFQVQGVETTLLAAGGIRRKLDIGYYRPDYVLTLAQERARQQRLNANTTAGAVLTDVQTASDGWMLTDATTASVSNTGVYGTGVYGTTAYG